MNCRATRRRDRLRLGKGEKRICDGGRRMDSNRARDGGFQKFEKFASFSKLYKSRGRVRYRSI